jgi:ribosomal protein S6--L-glutamate ligase
LETAIDKYLSLVRLAEAGLPVPETAVCQSAEQAMEFFSQWSGDVVVKPLFGGEGRGITRISDENLALRAFRMLAQFESVIYLQKFLPHPGFDIRVLVLGDESFIMRRRNVNDWRTNISRGAVGEVCEAEPQWIQLARAAADATGASFAGVDLLPTLDGRLFVLEVNAVPGWKALSAVTGIDIAARLLGYLERLVT